jgi:hypothetical protein
LSPLPQLLSFDFDADLEPAFVFDAYPDPAYHADADPDPTSQNDADSHPPKTLVNYGIPQPENNQFFLSTLETVDSSNLHFLQPRSFPNQAPKSGTKPIRSESGLLYGSATF